MRALIQRVIKSGLSINGREHSSIGAGLVVFLGVGKDDTEADALSLAGKTANLRIFSDSGGKFDLSLRDTKGEALVVSQFTLYADASKGRRPCFAGAAAPGKAAPLCDLFAKTLEQYGLRIKTGVFAADMQVELINDGPVTIWLDSRACQEREPG